MLNKTMHTKPQMTSKVVTTNRHAVSVGSASPPGGSGDSSYSIVFLSLFAGSKFVASTAVRVSKREHSHPGITARERHVNY